MCIKDLNMWHTLEREREQRKVVHTLVEEESSIHGVHEYMLPVA